MIKLDLFDFGMDKVGSYHISLQKCLEGGASNLRLG